MTDELEATAREIVLWFYDKDENATDGLIRTLKDKIYNALKTLRSKTRKEDADLVAGYEILNPITTEHDDINELVKGLFQAILKKEEENGLH